MIIKSDENGKWQFTIKKFPFYLSPESGEHLIRVTERNQRRCLVSF